MVISIVALLIAILLPALSAARESARIVQCTSNTRQIAMAWTAYLPDHDETFPQNRHDRFYHWFYAGRQPAVSPLSQRLTHRPLNPYFNLSDEASNGVGVFRCPSDRPVTDPDGSYVGGRGEHDSYAYFGNSYIMNNSLLERAHPRTPLIRLPVRMRDIQVPLSRVAVAGDLNWYYVLNGASLQADFHNDHDQVNLAFLDGHADYVQLVEDEPFTRDYSFLIKKPEPDEDG